MNSLNIKMISTMLLIAIVALNACRKSEMTKTDQDYATPYSLEIPQGFPQPNLSSINPLTIEGIALGRYLYYDTLLSLGGPMSGKACASCHFQSLGFIHADMPVLAHINLAWNRNFLWKGNISGTLEDIMQFEVSEFFMADMKVLKGQSLYPERYKKAFGDTAISELRTAYALAQFISTLVSGNSLYDQYQRKQKTLPADAMRGYTIFYSERGDCFHCHGNALFTDNDFHNIGLAAKSYADMGRYNVTGSAADVGKFKTPSLRNVALRNVFMHDGRYKSLREVIEHYSKGILHSEYLDPILDKPALNLSNDETNDLIAFLNTLTDSSFLSNSKFSKP